MKYVVLLMGYGDMKLWHEQSDAEQGEVIRQHEAFDAAVAERENVTILASEALGSGETATTVRTRAGQRQVTDGPYAEAVEQLGGFYLIEAPDLDVVLDLVTVLPAYDIQISPVVDPY